MTGVSHPLLPDSFLLYAEQDFAVRRIGPALGRSNGFHFIRRDTQGTHIGQDGGFVELSQGFIAGDGLGIRQILFQLLYSPVGSAQQEAQAALQALGYTAAEAARAVNLVRDQATTVDQLIMLALRQMGSL